MGILFSPMRTEEHYLLVDVYTGAKVKAPKLPPNNKLGYFSGIGILTAPFSSPNSCLILCSRAFMCEWQVGTNSWSETLLLLVMSASIILCSSKVISLS
uniref:Uncharacterized protein n=1 Tax=Arundo donax TaxID=35708 RepID=A0A0A9HKU9_ARUDO